MQGKASRLSQRPLQGHSAGKRTKRVSFKGGSAAAAPSVCAPAFLTTPIEAIRPNDNKVSVRFGINIEKSYKWLEACCKRFLKFVGVKFDFAPTKGLLRAQQLGELIDYFGKSLEPFGLSLCVSKKTPQGEERNILECVVYREGLELSDTILIFYVAPAWYLSAGTSAIYKRFMKFLSDSTNISLGVNRRSENFYLDMLINCEDAYDFDEPEEPDEDSVIKKYSEGGEFWNLFEEIISLPQETDKTLLADMERYRSQDCPIEEMDLLDAMIEGVPIIKDANMYWFEFNPEDDGLPDAYGNTDGDGWSSSVFASAILFSDNDGMAEQLLDCINNEVCSGIMMSGFNIHQWLSPTMKKADIDDFMRCKDLVADLDKWTRVFYNESLKFDKYGKVD